MPIRRHEPHGVKTLQQNVLCGLIRQRRRRVVSQKRDEIRDRRVPIVPLLTHTDGDGLPSEADDSRANDPPGIPPQTVSRAPSSRP